MGGAFPQVGHTTVRVDTSTAITQRPCLSAWAFLLCRRRCALVEDIRTLCHKCAQDIRNAGYVLKRTDKWEKTECDKCNRQGYSYILTKKGIIDSHAR